jgi:hypothetical protein
MHSRTIVFTKEHGGHSDKEILLRDCDNEELISCAFDKHGKCRNTCAAFATEIHNSIVNLKCLRMPGETVIGLLKSN